MHPWSLVSACAEQEWSSKRTGWQWTGGRCPREHLWHQECLAGTSALPRENGSPIDYPGTNVTRGAAKSRATLSVRPFPREAGMAGVTSQTTLRHCEHQPRALGFPSAKRPASVGQGPQGSPPSRRRLPHNCAARCKGRAENTLEQSSYRFL